MNRQTNKPQDYQISDHHNQKEQDSDSEIRRVVREKVECFAWFMRHETLAKKLNEMKSNKRINIKSGKVRFPLTDITNVRNARKRRTEMTFISWYLQQQTKMAKKAEMLDRF